MATTWNVIYLGNPGLFLDPTEGSGNNRNIVAENANGLVGRTFGSAADPLNRQVYQAQAIVQPNGTLNAGQAVMDNDNSFRNDTYRIDLNRDGTPEIYTHDTAVYYLATITYADGRPPANIAARLIQTTSGDLFLAPSISATDIARLEAGPIRSIRLNSIENATTVNFLQDRPVNNFVPCFTAGTLIVTPDNLRRVETLRPGELVTTLDHGAKPLRWTGQVTIDVADCPALCPIRIKAGALGNNQPAEDLLVSPQHRILVRSKVAQRMFDAAEVLVAAKQLRGLDGIEQVADAGVVTYVHLLFDQHEIVISNGALTESLFTGAEALKAVSPAARAEIMALFPELADDGHRAIAARHLVPGRQGRNLSERHAKNAVPLVGA
ncbi:Hint domain-containing protein [Yoonia vestfoldensis]|uniref:Hint domain-containing protein n=1 Tax=Yoonia vestfoldensis TaxID=245188 RepID=UPI00036441F0|nr:Hint domain-containing protein [Yoonia vestfoldensis]